MKPQEEVEQIVSQEVEEQIPQQQISQQQIPQQQVSQQEIPQQQVSQQQGVCNCCTNCGAELGEGSAFCMKCGASVNGDATPKTNKKKISKKVIHRIIAAVVAVAVVVGAVSSPWVRNQFMKLILSDEKYFQYVVKNNLEDGVDTVTGILNEYTKLQEKGYKQNGEMKFETGDGLNSVYKKITGENIPNELSWINEGAIEYKTISKDNKISLEVEASVNDQSITKAEAVADLNGDSVYLSLPEMDSQPIRFDIEKMSGADTSQATMVMNDLLDVIPSEKVVKKLLTRYIKCVMMQIDQVDENDEKVTVNGVTQKLTVSTLRIDDRLLKNAATAVLEEARQDEEIREIIEDLQNTPSINAPSDLYSQYLSAINEGLDVLRDNDVEFLGDEYIELSLYIDSCGVIVGTSLRQDSDWQEMTLSYIQTQKGNKYAEELSIRQEYKKNDYGMGVDVSFAGNGKISGGKKTGEYQLSVMGLNVGTMSVEKFDTNKLKKGVFSGKITIKPGKSIGGLLANETGSSAMKLISDLELVIDSDSKSIKKNDYTIALYYDGEMCVSFSNEYKIGGGKNVKLPSSFANGSDGESIESWSNTNNYNDLFNNLTEAGMPQKMISELRDALN